MSKRLFPKLALSIMVIGIIFVVSIPSQAFDGQRKGFLLGFGIGPGYTSFDLTYDSAGTTIYETSESKVGMFTNFKIGFAPSNKLMVYWTSNVSWFGLSDSTTNDESKTFAAGVGGLGISYYFQPEAPSLYITLGGGLGTWSQPFEGTDPWVGYGITGGLGYEFSRNWSLELNFIYGNATDEAGEFEFESQPIAIGLTINAIGY